MREGGASSGTVTAAQEHNSPQKGMGRACLRGGQLCQPAKQPSPGPGLAAHQASHANQRTCCPDAARSIQAARMLSRAAALLLSIILSSAGSACLTKLWVLWEGWCCVEERGRPCARVCLPACAVDQEQQQLRARAQVKRARARSVALPAPLWCGSPLPCCIRRDPGRSIPHVAIPAAVGAHLSSCWGAELLPNASSDLRIAIGLPAALPSSGWPACGSWKKEPEPPSSMIAITTAEASNPAACCVSRASPSGLSSFVLSLARAPPNASHCAVQNVKCL